MTVTLTDLPEEWRPIPGWDGLYEASTHGRVRSIERTVLRAGRPMRVPAKVLAPNVHHSGYRRVILARGGQRFEYLLHQVIALAFHGPRPEGMEVRHLNGDQTDNRPENLRYGTSSENSRDTLAHGNHASASRTHCPLGHALQLPNLVAAEYRRGHRKCRACNSARAYAYRHGLDDLGMRGVASIYYREYMEATA